METFPRGDFLRALLINCCQFVRFLIETAYNFAELRYLLGGFLQ